LGGKGGEKGPFWRKKREQGVIWESRINKNTLEGLTTRKRKQKGWRKGLLKKESISKMRRGNMQSPRKESG